MSSTLDVKIEWLGCQIARMRRKFLGLVFYVYGTILVGFIWIAMGVHEYMTRAPTQIALFLVH